jgi:uncharacterized protein YecE (DUF72 family)
VTRQLPLFPEPAPGAAPPAPGHERLAAGLPAGVRLGTSSWSFPGWRGIVYGGTFSARSLAREGLRAYAAHPLLGCVGIDRTFYAPPRREDLLAYAAQVPPGFRFVVKAPQDLTWLRLPDHPRSGDRAGEPSPHALDPGWAARFLVEPAVEALGDRLGAIVFQFPPQPGVPAVGEEGFAGRLGDFLEALPRGPLYAVEIRTRGWLCPAYAEALRRAGAVHCLTVHPTMPGLEEQAEAVGALDAPALVVRWMLAGRQRYEDAKHRYAPFDRIVDPDPDARRTIARLCRRTSAAGRPAYVTINNKAEGSAPLSAFALADELAASPPVATGGDGPAA